MNKWMQWCCILAAMFCFTSSFAQTKKIIRQDSISNYLHVMPPNWSGHRPKEGDRPLAFIFQNIDTTGKVNWETKKTTAFEQDGLGYFVKVTVPPYVFKNSDRLWCTGIIQRPKKKGFDTLDVDFGSVKQGQIKLTLQTTAPVTAAYLVPARIWKAKIEKTAWATNDSLLVKYRMHLPGKQPYAYVDETTFVVIAFINKQYKTAVYYTQPYIVAHEQTVSIP